MTLRPTDQNVLNELPCEYEVGTDAGFATVVIKDFSLPIGLSATAADLLLRLPPGFPDAGPDMFWLSPAVGLASGSGIPGTEAQETYFGRTWQRWSRHIGAQWRPGIDNLGTYLAYVRRCLDQAAGRVA